MDATGGYRHENKRTAVRTNEVQLLAFTSVAELELELILSRWLWERGEKGGASLQKQARVRALCGMV